MIDILVKSTGLDRSTIIDLLPFILIEIRNYTNQYFLTLKHNPVIKVENKKIYFYGEAQVSVGDTIELLNSENNTLIYQVKTIENGYIEVEQGDYIVDETDNDHIVMIKLSFKNVNINPKYFFNDKTFEKVLKLKEIFLEFDEDGSRKMEINEMEEMFNTNHICATINELVTLFFKDKVIKQDEIMSLFLDFYQFMAVVRV